MYVYFLVSNSAAPAASLRRPQDFVIQISDLILTIMTQPGMEGNEENIFEKKSLAEFLIGHNYHQVRLDKLATGHLVIEAAINDVPGVFILDTGAGTTVVDEKNIELFRLNVVMENVKGAGAGGGGLTVYSSADNKLSINEFHIFPFKLAAMSFEHVNTGLQDHGVIDIIHGVLGADLLEEANAIIDCSGLHLYLRMK